MRKTVVNERWPKGTRDTFEGQFPFFPFGVQYHRAPTPLPDEWEQDLREIARVGYTHVQYRPQWRWHERIRGQAVWEDLDCLFDLAQKNGLRVILKPMLETAPDWVFTELQGTRIGFHGVPIDPIAHSAYYVGGWWPCFDNPRVVDAAIRFVRQMVKRYHRHSALWFYDAWNEPVSRPLGQCQCPDSVASYREWLRRQYHTIEALNSAWGKAWTSFDTLRPPAASQDYVELFLWRQWAAHAISEQVRFVAQTIRSVDPGAFILVHVGGSSVVQDPICATSDDLLNAKTTDRYGTSFPIALHPKTPIEHAMPDYQSDWLRRVDPMYWCHEFYPTHACWCAPTEPRTLRRLVWFAIAGGASGMTFWQYRSERFGSESNGYGMREIDGRPTDRSEVIDGIAHLLKKHGRRLVGTRRIPARIGLLYNRNSDYLMRIQEIGHRSEIELETGNIDYSYRKALKAAHVMYLNQGETVDWVVPGDDLSGLSLLHVTADEMVAASTAEWLRRYVRNGGNLVVDFPFACRDERTWVTAERPSHGLADLLGCKEDGRRVTRADVPETAIFVDKTVIETRYWRIDLQPYGGEVIARWRDGLVAAVRHRFGRGTVLAMGCSLSLAFRDRWDDPVFMVFRWILRQAGVVPDLWTKTRLWVRRRRGEGYEIWFIFNMAETEKTIALPSSPKKVWQSEGTRLIRRSLRLSPGSVWVGELPEIEHS